MYMNFYLCVYIPLAQLLIYITATVQIRIIVNAPQKSVKMKD